MAMVNDCSVCKKLVGTCLCTGCKAHFCDDDFQNHRTALFDELDLLLVDRNELETQINEASSSVEGDVHLEKIDEWQHITIEKVKHAAKIAKDQVIKIRISKQTEISKKFRTLCQELEERRTTKSVVEQDLVRLKQKIHQVSEDIDQLMHLPEIEVNTKQSDQIDWNKMISIEKTSQDINLQCQPMGKCYGNLIHFILKDYV